MNTNTLTFTRFLASLYVVAFHFGDHVSIFNSDLVHPILARAYACAYYFFFLSGFTMLFSNYELFKNNKFSTKDYWIKRVARIYPLYFSAIILMLCFSVLVWKKMPDTLELYLNIALVQAWFINHELSFNYPGWTLSGEVFFYLLFPLMLRLICRLNSIQNLIVFAAVWFSLRLLVDSLQLSYYNPLNHLPTFYAGAVFAKVLLDHPSQFVFLKKYSGILFIVAVLVFLVGCHIWGGYIVSDRNIYLLMICAAMTFGLLYSKNTIFNFFTKPSMVKLGEYSYGVYLFQYPVNVLLKYLTDKFHIMNFKEPVPIFMFYLIFLILFSILMHYLIETPSRKLILKLIKK